MRLLMMASFGLEIVECGGAIARAIESGDEVFAAVLLSRAESRPEVREAARRLGIANEVQFLDFAHGEVEVTAASKTPIVELIRRVRPDVVIMQDPEHAQHDLDPDRRMIALLYAEALAVASREWRIEECGGHPPHPVPSIFYMTPLSPNCVVEISSVLETKLAALEALSSQMEFSGRTIRERTDPALLEFLVTDPTVRDDDRRVGLDMHRLFERSIGLFHGLAGHSGAVVGEAYRKEGPFVLDRLTA